MESEHFKNNELACGCCGENKISASLLDKLEQLRSLVGGPLYISSPYRCSKHNEVIGSKPTSSHVKGLAVDIAAVDIADINYRIRWKLLIFAPQVGFRRIGISKSFFHLDIDEDKIQDVVWSY